MVAFNVFNVCQNRKIEKERDRNILTFNSPLVQFSQKRRGLHNRESCNNYDYRLFLHIFVYWSSNQWSQHGCPMFGGHVSFCWPWLLKFLCKFLQEHFHNCLSLADGWVMDKFHCVINEININCSFSSMTSLENWVFNTLQSTNIVKPIVKQYQYSYSRKESNMTEWLHSLSHRWTRYILPSSWLGGDTVFWFSALPSS